MLKVVFLGQSYLMDLSIEKIQRNTLINKHWRQKKSGSNIIYCKTLKTLIEIDLLQDDPYNIYLAFLLPK